MVQQGIIVAFLFHGNSFCLKEASLNKPIDG